MKLMCDGIELRKDTSSTQQTELILGKSQFGKTYYASNEASDIIKRGDAVHMIDIASSWSEDDKLRMGTVTRYDSQDVMVIFYPTVEAVVKSAPYIANAFGFTSSEVISVLKEAITFWLIRRNGVVLMRDIVTYLMFYGFKKDYPFKGAANKAYTKIGNSMSFTKMKIVVNKVQAEYMALDSSIWDLSALDKEGASMIAQLIIFSMLETRREWFRKRVEKPRSFIIIDEFQNIDCTKNSVVGTCLVEGQRTRLYLILISQFIDGKYSDAVIHQLKQGGHFLYFRMTEEEVGKIAKQLAYEIKTQEKIKKILSGLPMGSCLYKGRHYIGSDKEVSEDLRIVQIIGNEDEVVESDSFHVKDDKVPKPVRLRGRGAVINNSPDL